MVKFLSSAMSYAKYLSAAFLGGIIASVIVGFLFINYYGQGGDSSSFLYLQGGKIKAEGIEGKNIDLYVINGTDLRNNLIPKIFQETVPSVVHITTTRNASFHPTPIEGSGSGIIIKENGYILTNNHVVEGSENPLVYLYGGEEYQGEVVGKDPMTDIAVVKIPAEGLNPAELGDPGKLNVGETAIAIGNPFRFSNSLTVGVISALNRTFKIEGSYEIENAIQTDAAINPGNSGGPLLNLKGEVVGINTAIFSTTRGFMGIGLAIPIDTAKKVAGDIVEQGKVIRPWMGIRGQDFTPAMVEGNLSVEEGALVRSVNPEGPSYGKLRGSEGTPGEANFTPGDIIVEIEGEEIETMQDVIDAVLSHEVEEKMRVRVYRDGEFLEFTVTLAERPKNL